MALTHRMAHHEFSFGQISLSVADIGDDYIGFPGRVAEAAVNVRDGGWEPVWRGTHEEAAAVFCLLKEALRARIHPRRWDRVYRAPDGLRLSYE